MDVVRVLWETPTDFMVKMRGQIAERELDAEIDVACREAFFRRFERAWQRRLRESQHGSTFTKSQVRVNFHEKSSGGQLSRKAGTCSTIHYPREATPLAREKESMNLSNQYIRITRLDQMQLAISIYY